MPSLLHPGGLDFVSYVNCIFKCKEKRLVGTASRGFASVSNVNCNFKFQCWYHFACVQLCTFNFARG